MSEVRQYAYARPRGLVPWNPHRRTQGLLTQVGAVLKEYRDHLPLTCRQLFYRLVGAYGYPKDEKGYGRLLETMNRARRSGTIPFSAIRDDGVTAEDPSGFHGMSDFWEAVRYTAEVYRRDRSEGQPAVLELWVEAAGMVPQVGRVAHEYGAAVFSSGGFDSLTAKHEAAQRMMERRRPTIVLHVGDLDPSGLSIFDSAAEDVAALVRDLGGELTPSFSRVAVTEAQVLTYELPTAPAKAADKRGEWRGGTVQCEALPPDTLADEVRVAIEALVDLEELVRTQGRA